MPNPTSDSRINAPEPALREDLRSGAATSATKDYGPDDGPLSPAQISVLQAAADEDQPRGPLFAEVVFFLGTDMAKKHSSTPLLTAVDRHNLLAG